VKFRIGVLPCYAVWKIGGTVISNQQYSIFRELSEYFMGETENGRKLLKVTVCPRK